MDNYEGPQIKIEILDNIFMVDRGIVKILLLKKETEPYKNYWSLPRDILSNECTIEEEAISIAHNLAGLKEIDFKNYKSYSDLDRYVEERVVGVSCIGITDPVTVSLKQDITEYEYTWFNINNLPKMLADHATIALDSIDSLKASFEDIDMLRQFFPSDFTLPELQKFFEQLENTELDRRNFRKKLMSLDILEETGDNNIGDTGRPAKLYRFKEN